MSAEDVPGSFKSKIVPIIVEHVGQWGPSTEMYLDDLANNSTAIEGGKPSAEFRNDWRWRLSKLLQRWNARVITKEAGHGALSRKCRGQRTV